LICGLWGIFPEAVKNEVSKAILYMATIAEKLFRGKAFLYQGADLADLTSQGPGGSVNGPHRSGAWCPESTGSSVSPRSPEEPMIQMTANAPLQLEIFSDYI